MTECELPSPDPEPVSQHSGPEAGSAGAGSAGSHRLVLLCCLGLLLAALLLSRAGSGENAIEIVGVQLPSVCAFRNTTGLPCPGCGLTRSWVELARGDLETSLARNRLGWLLMIYVMLQAVRHGSWLVIPAARAAIERIGRWIDRGLFVMAAALVASWIVTLSGLIAS
jgi:hypothetical protein